MTNPGFRIVKRLGQGLHADVFECVNQETEDHSAMKLFDNPDSGSMKAIDRELNALKVLGPHANIVTFRGVYSLTGSSRDTGIELELMSASLADVLDWTEHLLGENFVRCVAFQICAGLSHIHSFDLVHGDLKPGNILIRIETGEIKLCDFGLTKRVESGKRVDTLETSSENESRPRSQRYLRESDVLSADCTRWYRSFESLMGDKSSSFAKDVWALGCVLVECFTLFPLFNGTSDFGQLNAITVVLGSVHECAKRTKELEQYMTSQCPHFSILSFQDDPQIADLDRVGRIKRVLHPSVSSYFAVVATSCLSYLPSERPSCKEILQSDWLQGLETAPESATEFRALLQELHATHLTSQSSDSRSLMELYEELSVE